MIARWMLAATLFALLVGLAAWAAERALRALRRQQRFPWVAALAIAVVWPPVAALFAWFTPAPVLDTAPLTVSLAPPLMVAAGAAVDWASRLDSVLAGLWLALSVALLVQVVLAVRVLRRARRLARPMQVDGESVLVAGSLGPAVVGLLSPRIVVPEWLLQLDAPLRALVIRHEREHCRARDTGLVWLGVGATVLMPWNPAVWWISRRLRLAMEIDCDARTLRDGAEHLAYARLLLLIAQRQSTLRFVPMLAESSSHLGRRISAMRSRPLKQSIVRASFLAAISCVAAAVACSPRIAGNLTGPVPAPSPTAAGSASAAAGETAPGASAGASAVGSSANKLAVMAPGVPGPVYPAELRAAGIEGSVLVQFVVNSDGSIDAPTLKVLRTDHPGFVTAVRDALPTMRYLPAEVDGRKVRQLVQLPIQFALSGPAAEVRLQPSTMPSPTRAPAAGAGARGGMAPARMQDAAGDPTKPYFDFQVTKPVTMLPGSVGPVYPPSLRAARIEGKVLAQVVVDEDGRVDMSTFKVLKSDHADFADAVKVALGEMRFSPAEADGKRVKQLLQQPFQFALSR